jgi:hypothetical protein
MISIRYGREPSGPIDALSRSARTLKSPEHILPATASCARIRRIMPKIASMAKMSANMPARRIPPDNSEIRP